MLSLGLVYFHMHRLNKLKSHFGMSFSKEKSQGSEYLIVRNTTMDNNFGKFVLL